MEIDDQEILVRSSAKHRALTPLRALRGLVCILVFLSTAFVFVVFLSPPFAVVLRCFSVHHSRCTTSLVFGLWLGLWPFLFEKINGTKVVFSGDNVPPKERALIIANHRTEVDWMYLWDLALRKDCLGSIKYVLKGSLMNLPVFGWGFYVLEFVPLHRKWDLDEPVLRRMASSFSDPRDPLWLAIFPEGTDFSDEKREKSRKYAAEYGLPVLSNVLLPKTKGFCACLEALRDSLDAVYDVTIAYKNRAPSFSDNVFGVDPSEVHIHVRRIPIDEIPLSEAKSASWLISAFERKDELLEDFDKQGCFADFEVEEELSLAKCLANCTLVIVSAAVFGYLTVCSSAWFRIYVCLSCVYLALATHLQLRPETLPGLLYRTVFRLDREK